MASYIPDGYTIRGYLAEVPGLHEALRFRFRPPFQEEGSAYYDKANKLDLPHADQLAAKFIDGHLIDWDLKQPDTPEYRKLKPDLAGKEVPKNITNVLRLRRALFLKLFSVIMGERAVDLDPESREEPPIDPSLSPLEQRAADAKN